MRSKARLRALTPVSLGQSEAGPKKGASFSQRVKRRLFGIPPQETTFARRGFRQGAPHLQERLEKVGHCFACGYHAALDEGDPGRALTARLQAIEKEFQGFAYEGAAMALTLLDFLTPWKRKRLKAFLEEAGEPHIYMASVGAGWAAARLPWTLNSVLDRLHPLLRWLAVDGYGFHEGYFRWPAYMERQRLPRRLKGYALRAFDQGLGRSIWFVECADVKAAARRINAFAEHRRADLWCGLGLACSYAGSLQEDGLMELLRVAEGYRPELAQGASFAAKARIRAGNLAPHTQRACRILCGVSAQEAVRVTDSTAEDLDFDGPEPAYELWRRRVQKHFLKYWQEQEDEAQAR